MSKKIKKSELIEAMDRTCLVASFIETTLSEQSVYTKDPALSERIANVVDTVNDMYQELGRMLDSKLSNKKSPKQSKKKKFHKKSTVLIAKDHDMSGSMTSDQVSAVVSKIASHLETDPSLGGLFPTEGKSE